MRIKVRSPKIEIRNQSGCSLSFQVNSFVLHEFRLFPVAADRQPGSIWSYLTCHCRASAVICLCFYRQWKRANFFLGIQRRASGPEFVRGLAMIILNDPGISTADQPLSEKRWC